MTEQKYIFMMFSSTPSKMGRFIRTITKNRFNHVSLCLDIEGVTLYSFARKYRRHPFYGGFVKESSTRFIHNDRFAHIKLCAIPVTEEQYTLVKHYMRTMESAADLYIYNHLSAIGTIVNKRIRIENAYTCVEFNAKILREIGIISNVEERYVYSVRDLEILLSPYTIYEGSFEKMALIVNDVGDKFTDAEKVYVGSLKAFRANSKLLVSFLKSI